MEWVVVALVAVTVAMWSKWFVVVAVGVRYWNVVLGSKSNESRPRYG